MDDNKNNSLHDEDDRIRLQSIWGPEVFGGEKKPEPEAKPEADVMPSEPQQESQPSEPAAPTGAEVTGVSSPLGVGLQECSVPLEFLQGAVEPVETVKKAVETVSEEIVKAEAVADNARMVHEENLKTVLIEEEPQSAPVGTKKCSKCGKDNKEEAAFCVFCGNPFEAEEEDPMHLKRGTKLSGGRYTIKSTYKCDDRLITYLA